MSECAGISCRNAQLFNFNNKSSIQSSKLLTYLADLVRDLLPWQYWCELLQRTKSNSAQAVAGGMTHAYGTQTLVANIIRKQARSQCNLQNLQVVNGPSHPGAVGPPPSKITPPPPAVPKGPSGGGPEPEKSWREILLEKGPEGWAKDIRAHSGLLLTDTTWWAAPEPPVDVPSVFWDLHCMPFGLGPSLRLPHSCSDMPAQCRGGPVSDS